MKSREEREFAGTRGPSHRVEEMDHTRKFKAVLGEGWRLAARRTFELLREGSDEVERREQWILLVRENESGRQTAIAHAGGWVMDAENGDLAPEFRLAMFSLTDPMDFVFEIERKDPDPRIGLVLVWFADDEVDSKPQVVEDTQLYIGQEVVYVAGQWPHAFDADDERTAMVTVAISGAADTDSEALKNPSRLSEKTASFYVPIFRAAVRWGKEYHRNAISSIMQQYDSDPA